MNIEYLKYFATVAEYGSINKAAHALFISQPHLGNIIRDLEDELGTILLQRTRRGVLLTPEGTEFLRHVELILQEYEAISTKDTATRCASSSLDVSMTKFSHIMESFIDVVLKHKEDPQFSHQLNEGSPEDVIEDVYSGMSHIGVLNFFSNQRDSFLSRLSAKHLDYHFLTIVEPRVLLANNHPLLQSGTAVDLQKLSNYVFVRYMGEHEDFTNCIHSEQGKQNFNKSKRIIYTHGRSTLLHLIGSSDFYGIGIYDFTMQESAYNVRSVPIQGCTDTLEFGYIVPKGEELSPITKEFVESLITYFSAGRQGNKTVG